MSAADYGHHGAANRSQAIRLQAERVGRSHARMYVLHAMLVGAGVRMPEGASVEERVTEGLAAVLRERRARGGS